MPSLSSSLPPLLQPRLKEGEDATALLSRFPFISLSIPFRAPCITPTSSPSNSYFLSLYFTRFSIFCCLLSPFLFTLCNVLPKCPLDVHGLRLTALSSISPILPCAAPSLFDPCVNRVCVLPKVSLPTFVLTSPDMRVICISMLSLVLISFSCFSLRPVCQPCVCAAQAHPLSCIHLVHSFRIQPLRVQPSYSGFGSVPSRPKLNQRRLNSFVTFVTATDSLAIHHVCNQSQLKWQCQPHPTTNDGRNQQVARVPATSAATTSSSST
jgi:hypothetical protein